MKIFLMLPVLFAISCASKPLAPACLGATTEVTLKKSDADKIQGNVTPFLSDAQITQEHIDEGEGSIWRFSNMPADSIYHEIGLRSGDAIMKTNLGVHTTVFNLISDLSGIPSGTTNCLWVQDKEKNVRVIKVIVAKK
jgi:hypothetical protein